MVYVKHGNTVVVNIKLLMSTVIYPYLIYLIDIYSEKSVIELIPESFRSYVHFCPLDIEITPSGMMSSCQAQ